MTSSPIYISSFAELSRYLRERGNVPTWYTAYSQELPKTLSLRIPYAYAEKINWEDEKDPLLRMVLPAMHEQDVQPYEMLDPIGDTEHEPVPGLIHRYVDRCLLILTTFCGVHCRFCFRKEFVGKPRYVNVPAIISYLRAHSEIKEVIFTGGDPATFPEGFLISVLNKVSTIEHIQFIRIHTRVMVMEPSLVSASWLSVLATASKKKVVVALHINHEREIDDSVKALVASLLSHNVLVLSQTVLLKGVNDANEVLQSLFIKLALCGIKPYYLHHLDYAKGTHHFRVSIEDGKRLYLGLRGMLPGYCIPDYILDLPGGKGKVEVLSLEKKAKGIYEAINHKGEIITYTDPIESK